VTARKEGNKQSKHTQRPVGQINQKLPNAELDRINGCKILSNSE